MSAVALAAGEIEREGRRVLRKLMLPQARLEPSPQESGYALMAPGRGGLKARLRIPAALVEAFRRRDWLAPDSTEPLCLVLSDAGLGFLRRSFAEANPFAAQHRIESMHEIVAPDGSTRMVLANDGESPLGWLFRRKGPDGRPLITETQFEAGERLRRDFTLAQLSPRLGVDFTAPVVAGRRGAAADTPFPEIVLAAKQRYTAALRAVGPGLADLLVDVCCYLAGLEATERRNGWPQRAAKVVLQIALDRLAVHYGLGPAIGTGSRTRRWQAEEPEMAAREV